MMSLRQRLEESLLYTFVAHNWGNLEQTTEHNHIKHLTVLHLCSLVHRVNLIDSDILARRLLDDTKSVVDEDSAGFDFRFELLKRRLIQNHSDIILTEDRRRNALVAHDDSNVGSTTTLLWAIGRHPGNFLILHQSTISQNLTHREHTLTTET